MGKNIENHVTKIDLDSSGFLKGAEEVLKTIDKLEKSLEMNNLAKGVDSAKKVENAFGDIIKTADKAEVAVSKTVNGINSSINALDEGASRIGSGYLNVESALSSSMNAVSSAAVNAEGSVHRLANAIDEVGRNSSSGIDKISSTIQNVTTASEIAIGAATTAISAKIASIAKVAAVVGAAGLAISVAVAAASGKVRNLIGNTVNGIHTTVTEKIDAIKSSIQKSFSDIHSIITDRASSISDKIRDIAAVVVWNVSKACVSVSDAVRPTIEGIFRALQTAFPETTALLKTGFANIANMVKSAMVSIHTAITTSFDSAINAIREKFNSIAEAVRSFAERISSHFRKSKQDAVELGEGVAQLSEAMADAGDSASELESKLDGIFSDLTRDAAEGAEATEQVAEAEKDAGSAAEDAGNKAYEGFMNTSKAASEAAESTEEVGDSAEDVASGMEDIGDNAGEAFDETAEGAKEASGGLNRFFEIFQSALGGLGKDLGALPFKLKEISKESPIVGSALGLAFSEAGKQALNFLQKLRKTKEEAEDSKKSITGLGDAVGMVAKPFSKLEQVAFGALERIGQKAADTGIKLVKSLSVDNIMAGWEEYGLKVNSTQTIMASTGEDLQTVNRYLEELNKYADRTIYSFSDMTSNIGKFTNAGVDLDTAVAAMKGISNEAALSGANAQEASRAMYNFAQAISSGSVKLIDWKSIENANMATKGFKEQLIETAVELGTLKKSGEDYISTTKDANGHIADAFNATKNFNNSLSSQWMTTEVLMKTLSKYSDETTEFGKKAYAAAQDIKTGKQLMDTLKEAVGSGWSRTFELIVGDLEDAKKFWTGINNLISPILDSFSNFRNGLLSNWRALGGREELLGSLKGSFETLVDVLKAAKKGFETFVPPITGENLKAITSKVSDLFNLLRLNKDQIDRIKTSFERVGKGVRAIKDALGELRSGISNVFGKDIVSNGIERFVAFIDDISSKFETFAKSNVATAIQNNIGKIGEVAESIRPVFESLWNVIKSIASSISGVLSSSSEVILKKSGSIVNFIRGAINFIKGAIEVVGNGISKWISKFQKYIPTILKMAMSTLNTLGNILNIVGNFLSKHAKGLGSFVLTILKIRTAVKIISGPLLSLVGVAGKLVATVSQWIKIASFIKSHGAQISAVISKIQGPLGSLLKGIISGFSGAAASALKFAGVLGVVLSAVAIGVAVYKAYEQKLKENAEALYGLTDEEKEYNRTLIENVKAIKEEDEARKQSFNNIDGEFDYYRKLKAELKTIVDENGKVKEGYESRAAFIINELAEGLGTEINITDGVIDKYKELETEIDTLIQKKRIASKLSAIDEDVSEAKQSIMYDDKAYHEAAKRAEEYQQAYAEAKAAYDEAEQLSYENPTNWYYTAKMKKAEVAKDAAYDALYNEEYGAQVAADAAAEKYFSNLGKINNYEKAMEEQLSGDLDAAEKYLTLYNEGFETAANSTKERLQAQADKYKNLWQEAIDSGSSKETIEYFRKMMNDAYTELGKVLPGDAENQNIDSAYKKGSEPIKAYAKGAEDEVPDAKDRVKTAQSAVANSTNEAIVSDAENTASKIRSTIPSVVGSALEQSYAKAGGAGIAAYTDTAGSIEAEITKKSAQIAAAAEQTGTEGGTTLTTAYGESIVDSKDDVKTSAKEVSEAVPEGVNNKAAIDRTRRNARFYTMGLALGLDDGAGEVESAAARIANIIPRVTGVTLRERSPSKLGEEKGAFWGQGLVNGLRSLENAVRKESMTLSESMIEGANGPLSTIQDLFNGTFDNTITITPVLDLSQVQNGSNMLRGMLDTSSSLRMGYTDISGIMPRNVTPSKESIKPDNSDIVTELRSLRSDVNAVTDRIEGMQIAINGRKAVAYLTKEMDRSLGQVESRRKRGV